MAIPFFLPADEETEQDYRLLNRLLLDLYDVVRQILLRQRIQPPPNDNGNSDHANQGDEDEDEREDGGGGGGDGGGGGGRLPAGLPIELHAPAAAGTAAIPDLVADLPRVEPAPAPAAAPAPGAAPAPRGRTRRRRQRTTPPQPQQQQEQSPQQQLPQQQQLSQQQQQLPQQQQQQQVQRRRNSQRQQQRRRRFSGSAPDKPAVAAAAPALSAPTALPAPTFRDWTQVGAELRRIADQFENSMQVEDLKMGRLRRQGVPRPAGGLPWPRLLPMLATPPVLLYVRPLWAAVLILLGLKLARAVLQR